MRRATEARCFFAALAFTLASGPIPAEFEATRLHAGLRPPDWAVTLGGFRVIEIHGDHDGYPDTNETLDLMLTVRNPAGSQSLTNVVVRIASADPRIDCVSIPEVVENGDPLARRIAEFLLQALNGDDCLGGVGHGGMLPRRGNSR